MYVLGPYFSFIIQIFFLTTCLSCDQDLIDFKTVPRLLFCVGSLVVLDVVFRYLSLFLLYIIIKIGKNGY